MHSYGSGHANVVTWVESALSAHPAYEPSMARLRGAGAWVVIPAPGEAEAYEQAVRDASAWMRLVARG